MKYLNRNVEYKNLTIGIYTDSFNGKTGVTTPYMNFLRLFGKPYFIDTETTLEEVLENCNVLLVPGGADVDSRRYGEKPHPTSSRTNVHYEAMDDEILLPWLERGLPTIGICRGFQIINVLLGGTLFQNVSCHAQAADRTKTSDTLRVEANVDTPFFKTEKLIHYKAINSLHHQSLKDISEELLPIGFSPVYRNCESLAHRDKLFVKEFFVPKEEKPQEFYAFCEAYVGKNTPIFAVQYHPEEINCDFAIESIDNMLNQIYSNKEQI